MELLYLFIKNYNKFKNQNLNFGSEYIFNYSFENKELHIEKNELFIKNHYSSEKENRAEILNITSIIGQNGTGKTSILNFLKNNFVEGLELNEPVIFICKEDSVITVYYTEEIEFKNDFSKFDFKLIELKLHKEKLEGKGVIGEHYITFGYGFRGFDNTDLVYFSNVFDAPGGSMDLKGIHDISTNNLILADYDRDIKNKIIDKIENANYLTSFMNNDIHRQVKFIHKFYHSDKIPFNLPDQLYISVKNNYLDGFESNLLAKNKIYDYLVELINIAKTTSFTYINEVDRLKFRFITNIYISFLVDLMYSYQGLDSYLVVNKLLKNDLTTIKISDLIKNLELINFSKNKIIKNNDVSSRYFENIISFIKQIDAITIKDENPLIFDQNGLSLKFNKSNFESFDKFLNFYTNSIIIRPFLNFHWRNISSGEKALLNIYSRFYSLNNKDVFGDELNKNLIIMIDEGDLYLHPEWQKKFVKILIDFLPVIFESKRNGIKRKLQIIFTTNSPIPASDLLSYNTIFLESSFDENRNPITMVKDSLNEQKETFAANIHTLLSDSFFVKGGLIGDFASEKLNQIIDKLIKRVDLNREERENMRKLIHQIGEPVLKTKLMQMYNDRFNMDIHERLDEIEKHLDL